MQSHIHRSSKSKQNANSEVVSSIKSVDRATFQADAQEASQTLEQVKQKRQKQELLGFNLGNVLIQKAEALGDEQEETGQAPLLPRGLTREREPGQFPNTGLKTGTLSHLQTIFKKGQGEPQAQYKHELRIFRRKYPNSLLRSYQNQLGESREQVIVRENSPLSTIRCMGRGSSSQDKDKERFAEIRKILETIPTGKEALKLMEKYKVQVKFKAGGGSYYDSSSNSMVIDSNHPPARAALTFVHEMNHAKYHHEKIGADVKSLSRDDYVKKMVNEEAEGVIKSIEAKIELEGTKIDVSKISYPLEREYKKAFKKATDDAKAKNPKITEYELKKIGRKAGKKRVIDGFMNGELTTSNTGETYPNYYGKYWDKVHKK